MKARAIEATMAFGAHMHSVARLEELEKLERELDTNAGQDRVRVALDFRSCDIATLVEWKGN